MLGNTSKQVLFQQPSHSKIKPVAKDIAWVAWSKETNLGDLLVPVMSEFVTDATCLLNQDTDLASCSAVLGFGIRFSLSGFVGGGGGGMSLPPDPHAPLALASLVNLGSNEAGFCLKRL